MADASNADLGESYTRRYRASLLGNIKQLLAGLKGYDTMSLELIQNADDAGAVSMRFDIAQDALRLENSALFKWCGEHSETCPWDAAGNRPCDFHAISEVASNAKMLEVNQTGRFGIGFVSVYQITDTPIIRSGHLELMLDPVTESTEERPITHLDSTAFELPWAFEDTPARKGMLVAPVPANVHDLVQEALLTVARRSLIFLRHIESFEIARDGVVVESVTIRRETGRVTVQGRGWAEEWVVIRGDAAEEAEELRSRFSNARELRRSTAFAIAFPLHEEAGPGLLYAYLPTEQMSGITAHVNADFFPQPDRRAIVLTGQDSDRFWNEMLLAKAAGCIADNILRLRDELGAKLLWSLISQASSLPKDDGPFAVFWELLSQAITEAPVALSAAGNWRVPRTLALAYTGITPPEEQVLHDLGLEVAARDLRPFDTALVLLEARRLSAEKIISALEDPENRPVVAALAERGCESFIPLWGAVDKLLRPAPLPVRHELLARLRSVEFILDSEGRLSAPGSTFVLPGGLPGKAVSAALPGIRMLGNGLESFSEVKALCPEFGLLAASREIASRIDSPGAAERLLGDAETRSRVYDLLGRLPAGDDAADVRAVLEDVPFLHTSLGFVAPTKALLPGDFEDPTGSYIILEKAGLSAPAETFLKEVLKVEILSFRSYVENHLNGILSAGLSRPSYTAVIDELVRHVSEIDDEHIGPFLSQTAFILTRAGDFARAEACYFKTHELESVLGSDDSNWVDESALPAGQADLAQSLFKRLGMSSRPSLDHIVSRIEAIVEEAPVGEARAVVNDIAGHLARRALEFSKKEREQLEPLKMLEWLPAMSNGAPDTESWHEPRAIYRHYRSEAFSSQVPIVDLHSWRQASVNPVPLMNLLDMPAEPSTSVVVLHLEHCMDSGSEVKETVYQILSERLQAGTDAAPVERLRGRPFIYDPAGQRYLAADRVFWNRSAVPKYWTVASNRMRAAPMDRFFRHLGVKDDPGASDYAALLRFFAKRDSGSSMNDGTDRLIHGMCLQQLSEDTPEAITALKELDAVPFLLTAADTLVFPEEAVWNDDEIVAEPFGDDLDGFLTASPNASFQLQALLARFDVPRLSHVVRQRIHSIGAVRGSEGEALIGERAQLLAWLIPEGEPAQRLANSLSGLAVKETDQLQIVAEFNRDGDPVTSPPKAAEAFFDEDARVLYVRRGHGEDFDWPAAFKGLFGSAVRGHHGADVKQLALNATLIVEAATFEKARSHLVSAGLSEPEALLAPDFGEAEALADFEDGETWGGPEGDPEGGETPESDGAGDARDEEDVEGDTEGWNETENSSDGGDADTGNSRSSTGGGPEGQSGKRKTSQSGQKRSEWMRSYVGHKRAPGSSSESSGSEVDPAIDEGAMAASILYETKNGRFPERKSHTNPGYDIVSSGAKPSDTRYIEVKGLAGDWNDRGVKLSPTQFQTAQERGEKFWLYVVENAPDPKRRKLHAICNPFEKVTEYRFDGGWMVMEEEEASGGDLALVVGARVRHPVYKDGTIEKVNRRPLRTEVIINFGINGTFALSPNQFDVIDE